MTIALAIIGGTGLTQLDGLAITRHEVVHTPYGEPSGPITHGKIHNKEIVFLARHGHSHNLPPHKINYRANIWALQSIGVQRILAIAAVGGISKTMRVERLVFPHQIIDYSYGRANTFFEEGLTQVTHVDFSYPYCAELRQALCQAAEKTALDIVDSAVYGVTQGPRLETAAEIERMQRDGCDLVGMTGMPEAVLARELNLCYATCAVIANPAAGCSSKVISMDDIHSHLQVGMAKVRRLLHTLLSNL